MNLLIFSSCVPLFTALTGGIMVFFAWRYSRDSHEKMLNRRLLLYLLALTGTWTGLFLYLALPEVFQAFFPVYCLSTLAV
ncbi:MAG: hypothetical protein LBN93_04965, partial [Candidatus Symbiothrix sp.]|nr:hypothetical protein [Candidatus Symbiothrix sp.]